MDNKRKLSELIEAADNDTLKAVADAHPMLSDAKKDELYSRISERVSVGEDYADSVSGVEVKHGRGASRFVGFAAALALVLGGLGGGGLLLKNRMRGLPAAEIGDSAEVVEEETEAPTEAESEDYEAIAKELILREQDLMNFRTGADMEVDRTSPVYKNAWYGDKEHGREVQIKYYRVTDERYPTWDDVQAEMRAIYSEEYAKYMLEECIDEKDVKYYDTKSYKNDTGWYVRYNTADWNSGIQEWKGEPEVTVTPEGNIEAIVSRYFVSVTYLEAKDFSGFEEQMNVDVSTLTPVEDTEHSRWISQKFIIGKTEDGWRIIGSEPAEVENEEVTESDSEDYEAVAVARELTDKYLEYYRKLSGDGLEVDTSETLEKSETDDAGRVYSNTYYLVTDEDFPSNERICSMFDEGCDEIFMKGFVVPAYDDEWCYYNANNFLQKDGSWYILKERYENVGTISDWKGEPWGVEVNGDNIKAVRTYTYSSDKNEYDVEVYFTIGKTDDGWRITNFTKQRVTE